MKTTTCIFIALLVWSSFAQAQDRSIDCDDEANRDDPVCLGLPPVGDGPPITNAAPFLAPLGALGVLAGLGGGASTSTTSTTSTTSN